MKERLQTYRKALGKARILYTVSERLADSLKGGNDCEKITALYVMAPVMCMYVAWVLQNAHATGKKRLYFLARDGYSMYETARIFCEKMKLPIECRYLYCSRYAWRSAEYHLLQKDSLLFICLGGIDVNFRKLMSRAGLTESEGKEIAQLICLTEDYEAPLSYRQLRELQTLLADCQLFMDKMLEKSKRRYPLTAGYLRQEGLLDSVSWALVDSGWVGSMQKSLQHLLAAMGYEGKVEGYYFGLYEYPEGVDSDAYHCWYFEPGNGLRRKMYFSNCLFECIFSSPEGMTLGYEKRNEVYSPLLEKQWNPNKEKIVHTTEYLKQYAKEVSETLGESLGFDARTKENRKIAFSLLKIFMGKPTLEEANAFGRYVFCDDVIGEGSQKAAAELTCQQIRENRILYKSVSRLKKNGHGARESAWLEGSIVCAGMAGGELLHCAFGKYMLYLRKLIRNGFKFLK